MPNFDISSRNHHKHFSKWSLAKFRRRTFAKNENLLRHPLYRLYLSFVLYLSCCKLWNIFSHNFCNRLWKFCNTLILFSMNVYNPLKSLPTNSCDFTFFFNSVILVILKKNLVNIFLSALNMIVSKNEKKK